MTPYRFPGKPCYQLVHAKGTIERQRRRSLLKLRDSYPGCKILEWFADGSFVEIA